MFSFVLFEKLALFLCLFVKTSLFFFLPYSLPPLEDRKREGENVCSLLVVFIAFLGRRKEAGDWAWNCLLVYMTSRPPSLWPWGHLMFICSSPPKAERNKLSPWNKARLQDVITVNYPANKAQGEEKEYERRGRWGLGFSSKISAFEKQLMLQRDSWSYFH